MPRLMDRLGRRGKMTVTVTDGSFDVRLDAPGPFVNGRSTTDKADLFSHLRLGAKDWHGEGPDLAALLVECDEASRPRTNDVDSLRWLMERRQDTRTCGPPLPTYQRRHGWRPGMGRWLSTYSHAHEYLAGYLHYGLAEEQKFEAERRESEVGLARHVEHRRGVPLPHLHAAERQYEGRLVTSRTEARDALEAAAEALRACGDSDLADLSVGFILRKLDERENRPVSTDRRQPSPYRFGNE